MIDLPIKNSVIFSIAFKGAIFSKFSEGWPASDDSWWFTWGFHRSMVIFMVIYYGNQFISIWSSKISMDNSPIYRWISHSNTIHGWFYLIFPLKKHPLTKATRTRFPRFRLSTLHTSRCLMASAKRRSTSSVNLPDWPPSIPSMGIIQEPWQSWHKLWNLEKGS